jgi:hypothetical protein
MHLDPLLLSRLQWARVIEWHILLPAFTVGYASYIAVLEGLVLAGNMVMMALGLLAVFVLLQILLGRPAGSQYPALPAGQASRPSMTLADLVPRSPYGVRDP